MTNLFWHNLFLDSLPNSDGPITTAPPTPSNFRGTAGANTIDLAWTEVTDASYEIWTQVLSGNSKVTNVPEGVDSYKISGLSAQTSYKYAILSVRNGLKSSLTPFTTFTTLSSGSEPPPVTGYFANGAPTHGTREFFEVNQSFTPASLSGDERKFYDKLDEYLDYMYTANIEWMHKGYRANPDPSGRVPYPLGVTDAYDTRTLKRFLYGCAHGLYMYGDPKMLSYMVKALLPLIADNRTIDRRPRKPDGSVYASTTGRVRSANWEQQGVKRWITWCRPNDDASKQKVCNNDGVELEMCLNMGSLGIVEYATWQNRGKTVLGINITNAYNEISDFNNNHFWIRAQGCDWARAADANNISAPIAAVKAAMDASGNKLTNAVHNAIEASVGVKGGDCHLADLHSLLHAHSNRFLWHWFRYKMYGRNYDKKAYEFIGGRIHRSATPFEIYTDTSQPLSFYGGSHYAHENMAEATGYVDTTYIEEETAPMLIAWWDGASLFPKNDLEAFANAIHEGAMNSGYQVNKYGKTLGGLPPRDAARVKRVWVRNGESYPGPRYTKGESVYNKDGSYSHEAHEIDVVLNRGPSLCLSFLGTKREQYKDEIYWWTNNRIRSKERYGPYWSAWLFNARRR